MAMTKFEPTHAKPKRSDNVTIVMPWELLERFKAEADARGMPRSRLACEAIRFALDHMDEKADVG